MFGAALLRADRLRIRRCASVARSVASGCRLRVSVTTLVAAGAKVAGARLEYGTARHFCGLSGFRYREIGRGGHRVDCCAQTADPTSAAGCLWGTGQPVRPPTVGLASTCRCAVLFGHGPWAASWPGAGGARVAVHSHRSGQPDGWRCCGPAVAQPCTGNAANEAGAGWPRASVGARAGYSRPPAARQALEEAKRVGLPRRAGRLRSPAGTAAVSTASVLHSTAQGAALA